ncbi:tetratricopeptide repeat protein, partial [Trichodesmium erythraeum 21-75]|nr:tetratricopeptide repeat protein [Trichodesmium erythraeum 21-75]
MDKKPREAYINLIQQLLSSPNGEVEKILEANQELVDEGLLETMELCAQQFAAAPNFLRHLRSQLAEILETSEYSPSTHYSSAEYLDFLMEVLQATAESNGDSKVVYPLLQQNLDKLDDHFAEILQNWATAKFSEVEADLAKDIAIDIGEFSNLIWQFPLGSKANNMEISIAGCEVVLKVLTYKSHRKSWAAIQNNLGIDYTQRIRGDKAENIEVAIAAYQQALLVRTQTDFPMDWAMTQNNLGIAYTQRRKGNKAQNIEAAVGAFQQALLVRTQTDFPMDWAITQNNLGIAYRNRIRGKKPENIEAAIGAFQKALLVYSQTDFPMDWAT